MNWTIFKDYLPLLSICIILSGLIRQILYYNHFRMEIQDYISVPELILVLCNKIPFMLIIPIFVIEFMHITFIGPASYAVYSILGLGILSMLFARFIVRWDNFAVGFLGLLTIGFIYPFILNFLDQQLNGSAVDIDSFHQYFYSISVILYFIAAVSLQASRDINFTKKGIFFGTQIITKDATYTSDESHYFIGKTAKYYFIFHDAKENSFVSIIPEREVIKFKFKKAGYGSVFKASQKKSRT